MDCSRPSRLQTEHIDHVRLASEESKPEDITKSTGSAARLAAATEEDRDALIRPAEEDLARRLCAVRVHLDTIAAQGDVRGVLIVVRADPGSPSASRLRSHLMASLLPIQMVASRPEDGDAVLLRAVEQLVQRINERGGTSGEHGLGEEPLRASDVVPGGFRRRVEQRPGFLKPKARPKLDWPRERLRGLRRAGRLERLRSPFAHLQPWAPSPAPGRSAASSTGGPAARGGSARVSSAARRGRRAPAADRSRAALSRRRPTRLGSCSSSPRTLTRRRRPPGEPPPGSSACSRSAPSLGASPIRMLRSGPRSTSSRPTPGVDIEEYRRLPHRR